MSVILNPVEQYFNLEGEPLQNGYLYFGEVYGNPVTQPVMVYFDPEFTLPAAQPVRTVNGYPVRNGTATGIYAPEDVSILVQNKNREQVIYIESSAIDTGDTTTIYRDSDTSLNADDNNRTFILLNPIVQTFDPSVNLGNRWRVNIINVSNGVVTLDPNLSETIDGKANLSLQPNQILTVYCDGVNLKTTTSVFPMATVISAATLDLRAIKPKVITISGTNTISTIQMLDGDKFTAVFSGACPLTHGTNLQLPGAANYTTAAGDIVSFTSNGTVVRAEISKADGTAVTAPAVLNSANDPTFSSTSSTQPTSAEWVNGISFARNQTYQDVTASRALSTTYTNSLPKSIYVSVDLNVSSGGQSLLVDGSIVASSNLSGASANVSAIVPAGSTYRVNITGSNTLLKWTELK